jgi:hypothetical protein
MQVCPVLEQTIPEPLTDGGLLLPLDDLLNSKTGTKVFDCQRSFDYAAKTNQSRFPWAPTLVTVGLMKVLPRHWCCLPLASAFYLRKATLALCAGGGPGAHLRYQVHLSLARDPDPRRRLPAGFDSGDLGQWVRRQRAAQTLASRGPCSLEEQKRDSERSSR